MGGSLVLGLGDGLKRYPINVANLTSKLRRIRNELALMMQQVDDALARIEEEKS